MTATLIDLTAKQYRSRTLDAWYADKPEAARRAGLGVQAAGENSITSNLSIDQLVSLLGIGAASSAGVQVTAETAMRVSTVYACVSLLAGTIATLPFAIFERDGDTRRRAKHDYWWMLNEQPHENWTAAAAWEYLISAKLFYGDGFGRLLRPGFASSRVIGWEPMHPLRTQPLCDTDGRVYYRYQPQHGAQMVLDQADVIHLPSLGFDGLTSPSPITYAAREAIGTALAAESYTGKFFSAGATFDYALKTDATLTEQQLKDLRATLLSRLSGSRMPLILSGGLAPAQLSVNSKDAEIMATRLFGVEELCRIFGVPPHMVGHTDKTTSWGSGIEQQGIGFVRYTLQRHLTPIAQEFNRKLWPNRERFFVEHVTDALQRGDLKSRYEAHRIALGRAGEQPFMSTDEVRRLENMPPDPTLKRNEGSANAQPPDPAAG
jgi:HK97 family phage portal protein